MNSKRVKAIRIFYYFHIISWKCRILKIPFFKVLLLIKSNLGRHKGKIIYVRIFLGRQLTFILGQVQNQPLTVRQLPTLLPTIVKLKVLGNCISTVIVNSLKKNLLKFLKIIPYYFAQGRNAINKNTRRICSFLRQMNVFPLFSDHKNKITEKAACALFCRPVLVN